jgi:signal transduction histidine kinase
MRATSLTDTVSRAVALASGQLAAATSRGQDILIQYDPPDDPTIIPIDPAQIEDAVLNLIINAIDAIDGNGQVTVTVSKLDDPPEATINVTDTGKGINAEDLSRIFHPFFTTTKGGTGLGLPAVSRIVRLHGGRVEAHSEIGHGATFTIHLPMSDSL